MQPSLISPNRSYLSFPRPVSKNSGRISSKSSHTQNLPRSTNSIPTKPKVNGLFDSETELEQLAYDYEKEQGSWRKEKTEKNLKRNILIIPKFYQFFPIFEYFTHLADHITQRNMKTNKEQTHLSAYCISLKGFVWS